MNSRSRIRCLGMSSMSWRLSLGAITLSMPAAWAARAFSFRPPIGSTCPVSVSSPVIAVSSRTCAPGQQRRQGRRHRDARRGAVLGNRPRRHMDMEVVALEEVRLQAGLELGRVGADEGQRRLRGLAHHVAELAGDDQLPRARVVGRLDEQHVAAGRRPRQAGRDSRLAGAPPRLREHAPPPEHRARLRRRDGHVALRLALGELERHLAADRAQLALQIPHAGLARVLGDHDVDHLVLDRDLVGFRPLRSIWRGTR